MNDARIRRAVHAEAIRHYHRNPNARVVDELGLYNGRSRIDVAVMNGKLYGYEIKSEVDDLSRLPSQVGAYNEIFSRLTLVVADRLLTDALAVIPDWWGVIVARQGPRRGVRLERFRRANRHGELRARSIASLLWRGEAIDILESLGCEVSVQRAPRRTLYEMLSGMLGVDQLQREVSRRLRLREGWRDPLRPS